MADIFAPNKRSEIMSRVRSRGTSIEKDVSRILTEAGYSFLEQPAALPGSPDIVLRKHRVAVFVHGCFWHGHECRKGRLPSTGDTKRDRFWIEKIASNRTRDARSARALRKRGYSVVTVWQCQLKDSRGFLARLAAAIRRKATSGKEDVHGD